MARRIFWSRISTAGATHIRRVNKRAEARRSLTDYSSPVQVGGALALSLRSCLIEVGDVQPQFRYDWACISAMPGHGCGAVTEIAMRTRWLLAIALAVGVIGTGVAFSQNTPQPKAAATTEKVKTISARQWNRMKRQWSKQTEKWTACNRQADDQRLSGRASWPFIASCMTSS